MKPEPISDDELLVITDREIRNAFGYRTGKLSEARRKALQYYMGVAVGDLAPPDIEGRSQVVSHDVADTIEGMLPELLKIFTAGDNVVEFQPQTEEDEQAAENATDYCNYVFYRQNPGFQTLYTWFKDALLSKVGILKVYWDDKVEVAKEVYNGLNDVELATIADDPEVEIIEHTAVPDEDGEQQKAQVVQQLTQQLQQMQAQSQGMPPEQMQTVGQQLQQQAQGLMQQLQQVQATPVPPLHNITCKRSKKAGRVRIENVPPEEFLFSRQGKSIKETPFVAHQRQLTISDLRAMGYDVGDDLTDDDQISALSAERIERVSQDDEYGGYASAYESGSTTPAMRHLWVTECYLQVDRNGTGIAQWTKVLRAGHQILDVEECDGPPFVTICPIPLPHRFFGLSIADVTMETQRVKTSLLRAALDNQYIQANGRNWAVEGQVNLDDLLTSRPGGVVRIKQAGAVGPMQQGMGDSQGVMSLLEYMETVKEARSGYKRHGQSTDTNALSTTATGVNAVQEAESERVELVARIFAETGVTDLFNLILKLVCQYQDKPAQMKVAGQWKVADPREWRNRFDLIINVGLGTGNKDQIVQHLMALQNFMAGPAAQAGIVQPGNLYNFGEELIKNLGIKSPDKFFTNPQDVPQHQQAPDPALVKIQAESQYKQQELALEDQQHQREIQQQMQLAQFTQQAQDAQVQHQNEMQAQREALKAKLDAELQMHKAQLEDAAKQRELDFERWKAQLQSETQIYIAQMTAGSQEPVDTGNDPNNLANALAEALSGFKAAIEKMGAPRQIVRDPVTNRAIGIQ